MRLVTISRVAVGLLLAALTPGVAGASASPAASSNAPPQKFPVSFVLTSDTCSRLPEGTTITGKGTGTSITTDRWSNGTRIVINATQSTGTAGDQSGNRYRFSYSNSFRVSKQSGALFSGTMLDVFVLVGRGPANLSNGFVARVTTDLKNRWSYHPIQAWGDPISFPKGKTHCDPL